MTQIALCLHKASEHHCVALAKALVGRFRAHHCTGTGAHTGGPMAEWLRRGLQILARRFDSGSGLHAVSAVFSTRYVEISSRDISNRYWIKAGYIGHSRD